MDELEILLDELKNNNNLHKQLNTFFIEYKKLHSFVIAHKPKINIIFVKGSEANYQAAIEDVMKYSLFLIDKIISLTEINGKAIYSRQDILDLVQ